MFKIKGKTDHSILFSKKPLQKSSFLLHVYGLLSSVSEKHTVA